MDYINPNSNLCPLRAYQQQLGLNSSAYAEFNKTFTWPLQQEVAALIHEATSDVDLRWLKPFIHL